MFPAWLLSSKERYKIMLANFKHPRRITFFRTRTTIRVRTRIFGLKTGTVIK